MSEPTYRITLVHNPADGSAVCWTARVYRMTEPEDYIYTAFGPSREKAFDHAQLWCRASMLTPEPASEVYLSEDGDLLDPHEVQR